MEVPYKNHSYKKYYEELKKGNVDYIKIVYEHGHKPNPFLSVRIAINYGHSNIVSFIVDDYIKNHGSLGL